MLLFALRRSVGDLWADVLSDDEMCTKWLVRSSCGGENWYKYGRMDG